MTDLHLYAETETDRPFCAVLCATCAATLANYFNLTRQYVAVNRVCDSCGLPDALSERLHPTIDQTVGVAERPGIHIMSENIADPDLTGKYICLRGDLLDFDNRLWYRVDRGTGQLIDPDDLTALYTHLIRDQIELGYTIRSCVRLAQIDNDLSYMVRETDANLTLPDAIPDALRFCGLPDPADATESERLQTALRAERQADADGSDLLYDLTGIPVDTDADGNVSLSDADGPDDQTGQVCAFHDYDDHIADGPDADPAESDGSDCSGMLLDGCPYSHIELIDENITCGHLCPSYRQADAEVWQIAYQSTERSNDHLRESLTALRNQADADPADADGSVWVRVNSDGYPVGESSRAEYDRQQAERLTRGVRRVRSDADGPDPDLTAIDGSVWVSVSDLLHQTQMGLTRNGQYWLFDADGQYTLADRPDCHELIICDLTFVEYDQSDNDQVYIHSLTNYQSLIRYDLTRIWVCRVSVPMLPFVLTDLLPDADGPDADGPDADGPDADDIDPVVTYLAQTGQIYSLREYLIDNYTDGSDGSA